MVCVSDRSPCTKACAIFRYGTVFGEREAVQNVLVDRDIRSQHRVYRFFTAVDQCSEPIQLTRIADFVESRTFNVRLRCRLIHAHAAFRLAEAIFIGCSANGTA